MQIVNWIEYCNLHFGRKDDIHRANVEVGDIMKTNSEWNMLTLNRLIKYKLEYPYQKLCPIHSIVQNIFQRFQMTKE